MLKKLRGQIKKKIPNEISENGGGIFNFTMKILLK